MRIAWLDTLRVLASFLVILSHFAYTIQGSPKFQAFLQFYVFNIGTVGVIIFFAVSGYLAANSLERSTSTKEFYRRKIIRILVPYVAAYLVFLALLKIFAGLQVPIAGILFSIVPVDANLIKFFNLPSATITGEWFIGTIIYLYAAAPFLYAGLKKNPALMVLLSFALAFAAGTVSLGLHFEGRIFSPSAVFAVRLPEFLAGMILFRHQNFIAQNIRAIAAVFIFFAAYNFLLSQHASIWAKIFIGEFGISIPAAVFMIFIAYAAAVRLNEIFPRACKKFNAFSNISYMAMLIHHQIIFQLERYIFVPPSWLKATALFALVLIVTAAASEIIRRIYKPLEDRLIKGGKIFG